MNKWRWYNGEDILHCEQFCFLSSWSTLACISFFQDFMFHRVRHAWIYAVTLKAKHSEHFNMQIYQRKYILWGHMCTKGIFKKVTWISKVKSDMNTGGITNKDGSIYLCETNTLFTTVVFCRILYATSSVKIPFWQKVILVAAEFYKTDAKRINDTNDTRIRVNIHFYRNKQSSMNTISLCLLNSKTDTCFYRTIWKSMFSIFRGWLYFVILIPSAPNIKLNIMYFTFGVRGFFLFLVADALAFMNLSPAPGVLCDSPCTCICNSASELGNNEIHTECTSIWLK